MDYAAKLNASLDNKFDFAPERIFTSSYLSAHYLKSTMPNLKKVRVVGMPSMEYDLN